MRPRSLAARIVTGVVCLHLLLTALLVSLGVYVARTELLSAFDVSLQSKALSIRALVRYSEETPPQLIFDSSGLPPSSDPTHPDKFIVYLADGSILAQTPGWRGLPPDAKVSQGEYARFLESGIPFRALTLRNVSILDREGDATEPVAKITVVYAASRLGVRDRVWRVGVFLGATGLLLLLPMTWLSVWAVRRSFNPLRDLAARAGQITVRQWSFDAPSEALSTPELAPLTEALRTLVSRLRDSFARQRQFTGDLAHELKTSVAIIKSGAQVLLQSTRSATEYRGGIEELLSDCERMESLVERMLRLARVEQWSEEGTRERLATADLAATCEAAISRVAALAAAKDISIKFEGSSPMKLHADSEDLELVWVNLLDNAVRHSPQGSTVTLRLKKYRAGDASVEVTDAGEGIPPEEIPQVFERFHRGNNSKGRTSGSFGLGLAICKAIVEAYGGSIHLKSDLGRGTSVSVQLPIDSVPIPTPALSLD